VPCSLAGIGSGMGAAAVFEAGGETDPVATARPVAGKQVCLAHIGTHTCGLRAFRRNSRRAQGAGAERGVGCSLAEGACGGCVCVVPCLQVLLSNDAVL
jgi:hypothetical protein